MDTQTWLTDKNGNRCSVEYYDSRKAAQAALDSLKNCSDCTNCSDCSRCSYCHGCSACSDCSYCSHCHGCHGCYDCYDCSRCSYCSHCHGCHGCSDCSNCSRCSDCHHCSYCSRCSYCHRCSGIAKQENLKNEKHELDIPVIENIHVAVYNVVSQPNALDMKHWHTCETTHCRAGWVVHLAGEKGYTLEKYFSSTALAAQLIYKQSGYEIHPGKFYESNEQAMEDIRALAKVRKCFF